MALLVGVFQVLAAVVVVGGVAKLWSPEAFASTLRSLGLPGSRPLARAVGLLEVAVGAACLWVGGRTAALVVALTYTVFTLVVVAAQRSGAASCGCFGATEAPPSVVHVAVNAVSAVAALAAAAVPPPGLAQTLSGQPAAGVPYLLLTGLAVWLVVVVDTTGARVVDELGAVRRLGPTFRDNNVRGVGVHATPPARRRPRGGR